MSSLSQLASCSASARLVVRTWQVLVNRRQQFVRSEPDNERVRPKDPAHVTRAIDEKRGRRGGGAEFWTNQGMNDRDSLGQARIGDGNDVRMSDTTRWRLQG